MARFISRTLRWSKNEPLRSISNVNFSDMSHKSTIMSSSEGSFGKLSKEWWNEKGEFKALHSLNRLRVPLVRDGILSTRSVSDEQKNGPFPLQGMKILDVGCGGGILSESLSRLGCEVVGIDSEIEGINVAKKHIQLHPQLKNRVTYQQTTVEAHELAVGPVYDAVVASEVIEHVDNQSFFLETCTKLLQPGGSVFITTLNRTTESWFLGIVVAEDILRIVPKGIHDWNQFISPGEIQRILELHGCETRLTHGMLYDPFCNKWSFIPYVGVNYALQAVKQQIQSNK